MDRRGELQAHALWFCRLYCFEINFNVGRGDCLILRNGVNRVVLIIYFCWIGIYFNSLIRLRGITVTM